VKGYYQGEFKDDDKVKVLVNNTTPYVDITNPDDGSKVSGTVLVTTNTGQIKMVFFYLNGELVYKDDVEPFEFKWDTTQYENGEYEILAEGYQEEGVPVAKDAVRVGVSNPLEMSLGLLSLLILLIFARVRRR
jgi:hypothetical protein